MDEEKTGCVEKTNLASKIKKIQFEGKLANFIPSGHKRPGGKVARTWDAIEQCLAQAKYNKAQMIEQVQKIAGSDVNIKTVKTKLALCTNAKYNMCSKLAVVENGIYKFKN